MEAVTVYLKCKRSIETNSDKVCIGDIGSVFCTDAEVCNKLKRIIIHRFDENGALRCAVNVIRIIELMEESCPNIRVQVLGETDVLIERTRCSKNRKIKQAFKIFVVSMVSFFGTAFAIMAYHVDVGINKVFSQVYGIVLGAEPEGINVMSVSYSVGVAAGIIIFFNHVGGRRLTKDPTPIEVAMRKYEQDVDVTLIENADREGKEEDVR
jgi:stage V sporulation protein AA